LRASPKSLLLVMWGCAQKQEEKRTNPGARSKRRNSPPPGAPGRQRSACALSALLAQKQPRCAAGGAVSTKRAHKLAVGSRSVGHHSGRSTNRPIDRLSYRSRRAAAGQSKNRTTDPSPPGTLQSANRPVGRSARGKAASNAPAAPQSQLGDTARPKRRHLAAAERRAASGEGARRVRGGGAPLLFPRVGTAAAGNPQLHRASVTLYCAVSGSGGGEAPHGAPARAPLPRRERAEARKGRRLARRRRLSSARPRLRECGRDGWAGACGFRLNRGCLCPPGGFGGAEPPQESRYSLA